MKIFAVISILILISPSQAMQFSSSPQKRSGSGISAQVPAKKGSLIAAAQIGNSTRIHELLTTNVHLDETDSHGNTALYYAIYRKHFEVVKALLEAGANPFVKDINGITYLHTAAYQGSQEIVNLLIKHYENSGVDPNSPMTGGQFKGFTPLYIALQQKNFAIARLLIAAGAQGNDMTVAGFTSFHYAVHQNHCDIVSLMLEKDHGNNYAMINQRIESGQKESSTPLMCATENGHVNMVKLLLSYGALVSANDRNNECSLHKAARARNLEILNDLLARQPMPDPVNKDGITPLSLAISVCFDSGVEVLLRAGAQVNRSSTSRLSPLHEACLMGNESCVRTLLMHGACIYSCDNTGENPLHKACRAGSSVITKTLNKLGVSTQAVNSFGQSPLHLACENGCIDLVMFLLENNNTLNASDNRGETPLHKASKAGNADCAHMLIMHGADVNAINANGLTSLHLAVQSGSLPLVELLIKYGAFPSTTDEGGSTALHYAATFDHADIAQKLLLCGVNPNAVSRPSPTSESAVTIASFMPESKVLSLLLRAGGTTKNHELFLKIYEKKPLLYGLHASMHKNIGLGDFIFLLVENLKRTDQEEASELEEALVTARAHGEQEMITLIEQAFAKKKLSSSKYLVDSLIFTLVHGKITVYNQIIEQILKNPQHFDLSKALYVALILNNYKAVRLLLACGTSQEYAAPVLENILKTSLCENDRRFYNGYKKSFLASKLILSRDPQLRFSALPQDVNVNQLLPFTIHALLPNDEAGL